MNLGGTASVASVRLMISKSGGVATQLVNSAIQATTDTTQ
jgi:hypothetical protein